MMVSPSLMTLDVEGKADDIQHLFKRFIIKCSSDAHIFECRIANDDMRIISFVDHFNQLPQWRIITNKLFCPIIFI